MKSETSLLISSITDVAGFGLVDPGIAKRSLRNYERWRLRV